jgi:pimeloyl-ACP methyl ester carboxylesterase
MAAGCELQIRGVRSMRFVFVHGGFHGAWCWERTIAAVQALGHEGVAIDLPGHGARLGEPSDVADRRDSIVEVVEDGDFLVGHSGGGFDITVAADAVIDRIGGVIYLAAGLPMEGRSMPEALMHRPEGVEDDSRQGADAAGLLDHIEFRDDGSVAIKSLEDAREIFYHDCDDETVAWAWERLTPELAGDTATLPISTPDFWASDVQRSFIHCLQDHAQAPWMAEVIAGRLGVQKLEIDASHSPFLSRPAELAELLVQATTTPPVGPLRSE